ncbi:MAG: hypothetical protein FWE16_05020 [Firmicutes bacterium]|nr:hypothetical protein [Bacillota bacterium]
MTTQKTYSREEANRLLYEVPLQKPTEVSLDATIATRFNNTHDVNAFNGIVSSRYQEARDVLFNAKPLPQSQSAVAPVFDSYIKPGDTIPQDYQFQPKQTFRPVIFDMNLSPIQEQSQQPQEQLEKIAEMDTSNYSVRDEKAHVDDDQDVTMKLNTRGFIAVASFVAVLALVVALIIINAVNISASGARIDALRTENIQLSQQFDQVSSQRYSEYNRITNEIRNQFDGDNFVQVGTPVRIPPQVTWQFPDNPDHSTNWFDRLSNFLSGLFR